MKHTYELRARYAQHLKHAQNHITRAVAAIDSWWAPGWYHAHNNCSWQLLLE